MSQNQFVMCFLQNLSMTRLFSQTKGQGSIERKERKDEVY